MEQRVLLGAKTWKTRKTVEEKAVLAPPFSHGCFSVLLSESVNTPLSVCAGDINGRSPCVC